MACINIFDPGLLGYAGHHADINFRLSRALRALGNEVVLYAAQSFRSSDADIDVRPVFRVSPYWAVSHYHLRGSMGSASAFEMSSDDVLSIVAQAPPADVSIFPTLFACQANALASLMPRLRRVSAIIHTPPDWRNAYASLYWREAFRRLESHASALTIGVLERELLLEYESLLESRALSVRPLPIPHDGFVKSSSAGSPPRVGVLGHQRGDKGLGRLNDLVVALRAQGYGVVLHDSSGTVQAVGNDRGLMVFGYEKDFHAVLRYCDVVVLDYDLDAYRFNGSGIAWECIASGIPLVAPLGTSISRLLQQHRCGSTFVGSNLASLLESLKEVLDSYERFASDAHRARTQYHGVNGTERLAEALVSGV